MSANASNESRGQRECKEAFVRLLAEDADAAVQLVTGMFVAITLEYARRRGHETDKQVHIEGGHGRRAITIHEEPKP